MTISNSAAALQLGLEAARRWKLSGEHGEAGDATAIVALYGAARTMTFEATVERKKDETAETFNFEVQDMLTPYWNNDGSKDTRKMAARMAALAERLFGISELTNAVKQRISRTVMAAVYLHNQFAKLDDDAYFARVTLKAGKLNVPYGVVKEAPGADASDNDRAVFDAMKERNVALDGKQGLSLAELSKRANPPREQRAAGKAKDKGADFVASLDFVSAIVAQQLSTEASESDVGLNTDLRRKLFTLAQQISEYFAADPLEDEELGRKAA
jgi:hypothetical protein